MAHDVKITGNKKKGYVATCQEPECYWMNLGHLVLNRAGIEAKAREHQEKHGALRSEDRMMLDNPFHPEGIYACEGCELTYAEYVNGCVRCWDASLTIEENRRRFPHRRVRLLVPDSDHED